MTLKFGEDTKKNLIEQQPSPFRLDFQYFGVNSTLNWRKATQSGLPVTKRSFLPKFLRGWHRGNLVPRDSLHVGRWKKDLGCRQTQTSPPGYSQPMIFVNLTTDAKERLLQTTPLTLSSPIVSFTQVRRNIFMMISSVLKYHF